MFIEILQNGALLCIAPVGLYWFAQTCEFDGAPRCALMIGFAFGLTAFMVTVTPVRLADTATVDARAGPVIIAGVLGGPLAAGLAAVMGGIARWFVGGSFADGVIL